MWVPNEYAHILDLSNGAQKMLDVNQRSFGWASPGEVVIAPQMANPVTHYDGNGQPTYMAPVHGTATVYDINAEVTERGPMSARTLLRRGTALRSRCTTTLSLARANS